MVKDGEASGMTKSIWEAVKTNDLQKAYHLIAASTVSIVNTTFHHVVGVSSSPDLDEDSEKSRESDNASSCGRDSDSKESMNSLRGCSLLHLACQNGNQVMVELLLQFGADINVRDSHGRTPLHQCISQKNNTLAKLLLRRYNILQKPTSNSNSSTRYVSQIAKKHRHFCSGNMSVSVSVSNTC